MISPDSEFAIDLIDELSELYPKWDADPEPYDEEYYED